MLIAEFNQHNVTIAEVRGRIDTVTSGEFGSRVTALVTSGAKKVLVDMSNIIYISSAGFRALLEIGKQSEASSCTFGLCGLSREIQRLFEISGFADIFSIYSTRDEAIAVLSKA
jgi:anti-sigma B factor antagonist